jgi:ABC-type lipoprotein export system ATPase subunit
MNDTLLISNEFLCKIDSLFFDENNIEGVSINLEYELTKLLKSNLDSKYKNIIVLLNDLMFDNVSKTSNLFDASKHNINDLFEKDSVEMSGGERQRMSLYISLTSKSTVILLDEILSEMSSEETSDVPEGGGWLCRVINTLVNWQGRYNKIIILVGHGILDLIPNKKRVIKLKLYNENNQTILSSH